MVVRKNKWLCIALLLLLCLPVWSTSLSEQIEQEAQTIEKYAQDLKSAEQKLENAEMSLQTLQADFKTLQKDYEKSQRKCKNWKRSLIIIIPASLLTGILIGVSIDK